MPVITFRSDVPIEDTMEFEKDFPEPLALELSDKREVLETAIARWMFLNGILIGETYGHRVRDVDEFVPGVTTKDGKFDPRWDGDQTFYVYTTGILAPWRMHGFASILKSHLLGILAGSGIKTVIGHSRKNGSLQLNQKFGAKILSEHSNWYDTGETYWMYEIVL